MYLVQAPFSAFNFVSLNGIEKNALNEYWRFSHRIWGTRQNKNAQPESRCRRKVERPFSILLLHKQRNLPQEERHSGIRLVCIFHVTHRAQSTTSSCGFRKINGNIKLFRALAFIPAVYSAASACLADGGNFAFQPSLTLKTMMKPNQKNQSCEESSRPIMSGGGSQMSRMTVQIEQSYI